MGGGYGRRKGGGETGWAAWSRDSAVPRHLCGGTGSVLAGGWPPVAGEETVTSSWHPRPTEGLQGAKMRLGGKVGVCAVSSSTSSHLCPTGMG